MASEGPLGEDCPDGGEDVEEKGVLGAEGEPVLGNGLGDVKGTERTLMYPNVKLLMSLKPTRSMHAYVIVRKYVIDQWYDCGRTESRPLGLEQHVDFETPVNVQYHVGIDDFQRVSFVIYDGDYFNTKNGYFFAKMDLQLNELLFGETYNFPIYRETDVLCTLGVTVTLSYDAAETVTLPTDDFPGLNPEELAAEKLKIAFFKDEPPTFASLEKVTPFFMEKFGTYVFRVHALNLMSPFTIDPDLLILEATQVRIALCKGSSVRPDSDPKLQQLWASMPVSKKYDINVLELKISHEDLTGERDVKKDGDPSLRLVFQVLVKNTGTAAEMDKREFIVSTVSMMVTEVLEVARKTIKAEPNVAKKLKLAVNFKQARNMAKQEKVETSTKADGGAKKARADAKKGGYDSFDEEIEKMIQPIAPEPGSDEDELGAAQVEVEVIVSKGKKRPKSPFGTLTLYAKREDVAVKCEPGFSVYIEKLGKKL